MEAIEHYSPQTNILQLPTCNRLEEHYGNAPLNNQGNRYKSANKKDMFVRRTGQTR